MDRQYDVELRRHAYSVILYHGPNMDYAVNIVQQICHCVPAYTETFFENCGVHLPKNLNFKMGIYSP